ncbi:MAG: CBS domain-containing protein [Halobacteriaceae archaeon]
MHLPTSQDIREKRQSLQLTQSELADLADVSQPLIARIENGDVDPRLSTLRKIINALEEAEGDVVRARDIMHSNVVSVGPDDQVKTAVDQMQQEGFSQLPVITDGVPIGSISEDDILHAGEEVGDQEVREIMGESFPTVSASSTLEEITSLLDHYKAVMVTEAGETLGIITGADVAAQVS